MSDSNHSEYYSDNEFSSNTAPENSKKKVTKKQGKTSNNEETNVNKRIISSNRLKINDLRNKVLEYADLIEKNEREKKDLLRLVQKHERIIKKYETQENFMPSLIQRQTAESHALNDQIRLYKERLIKKDKKIKDMEEELEKSQRLLKKLKGLVDDKNLAERDVLNNRLIKMEEELKRKSACIENLEHYIENLKKNHNHETNIKNHQQQQFKKQFEFTKFELDKLRLQLMEKEKELNIRNIYTQKYRGARVTNSVGTTPTNERSLHSSNISLSQRSNQINNGYMKENENDNTTRNEAIIKKEKSTDCDSA